MRWQHREREWERVLSCRGVWENEEEECASVLEGGKRGVLHVTWIQLNLTRPKPDLTWLDLNLVTTQPYTC